MRSREERLSAAYTTLHAKLSEILYNEDPDGMGVTVGAPDDEYSREASNLIRWLQDVRERDAAATVVQEMFPAARDSLVDKVFEAWTGFLRAVE